ncbi:MAG: hypothetical protein P5702_05605 [Limnospira sp. PMC 1291.21]|uniref:Uncharacterized protein n=3 Tax=Limnospira TaxID=2596745 RepID=A0A9P1NX04_9CYAN|nr:MULTISPECIES: hypothetical protein [Limnospira]EKD10991.1 hypothetical protein SPLC1_S051990 [Arthrospira platensis C1]MBD2670829.1 hypothetical protein [Arthrospira platensis FACHB-439]MDC0836487.1 hypothetical protein [Limnoraphis robusta]MDT9184059.1 hypothetical protein [Limnospira sp. PMC 289.06]MDY7055321.1 hypothetical protein [Limnospira fusiformis LS22]QJB28014.1 hypothetical protein HFV01_22355 [Limnospira fusiformis SAG 85.79]
MNEVVILGLMVSSLGVEAVLAGSWLCQLQDEQQQEYEEEEEILTHYDSDNPNTTTIASSQSQISSPNHQDWEYKIVRAQRDLFRNPKTFEKLCQEEAIAGWVMVEKLDDRRIRFRRPSNYQPSQSDQVALIDPYRSSYGSSFNLMGLLTGFAFLIAIILPAYLGYILVSTTLNTRLPELPITPEITEDNESEDIEIPR